MSAPQRTISSKERQEERILRFSFVMSAVCTGTEVIMALFLGSYSVLIDSIYDLADLVLLGPFLVLVPLLYRPVTERHPYGYSQLESVFLIVKYGVLLSVIVSMVVSDVQAILAGGNTVDFNGVALYEFGIGLLCLTVLLILRHLAARLNSPTLAAEIYLWKQDAVGSLSVAIVFCSQMLLQDTAAAPFIPYLDPVVAIVMAIILFKEPLLSIIHGFRELVLFAPDEETMATVHAAVDQVLEQYPFTCSFLDVIQTGRKVWIEVYVSPDEVTGMVDIRHWAAVRAKIREALAEEFDQIYVELIPDIPDHQENG